MSEIGIDEGLVPLSIMDDWPVGLPGLTNKDLIIMMYFKDRKNRKEIVSALGLSYRYVRKIISDSRKPVKAVK